MRLLFDFWRFRFVLDIWAYDYNSEGVTYFRICAGWGYKGIGFRVARSGMDIMEGNKWPTFTRIYP